MQPVFLPEINSDEDAIKYMPKVYFHTYFDKDSANYEEIFNEFFSNADPRLREKVFLCWMGFNYQTK